MIFYRVQGIDTGSSKVNQAESRREECRRGYEVSVITEKFNGALSKNEYYFLVSVKEGIFKAGIICDRKLAGVKTLERFLKRLEIVPGKYDIVEITLKDLLSELTAADRYGYVRDADEVLEYFRISDFNGIHLRGSVDFDENLVREASREELEKKAEACMAGGALAEELDRIYEQPNKAGTKGHPVHYMVMTDDTDLRRELPRALMSALYMNGRLENRRYCFTDITPGMRLDNFRLNKLYLLNEGGTIIIRYCATGEADSDSDKDTAGGEVLVIERLCEYICKYRNRVLTILCLPRACNRLKSMFYENLGSLGFMELAEEQVSDDRAREFIKKLARQDKVRSDKLLTGCIEEGRGYMASELHEMYEEWYNNRLRSRVYPQYSSLAGARKMASEERNHGSAYEELMSMVGLDEAKKVIDEALAFYKAQKLYADMGMKKLSPSMHMIFTGNPGTAKTSVARLFAGIMKDNRILARGQFVEVGRADLVGRFVGWTAPVVKNKFKEAEGGVMFIDEAYSLVDGHENSFGDEAINTIVQEMENHREDVIVIFAGYPDKMEKFLQRNPGLRSRIAFHVPFSDYNADELCRITELMAGKASVTIDEGAMQRLHDIYETACRLPEFGNGRFARNVLERARMKQAHRLSEIAVEKVTKDDITRLIPEDFYIPELQGCSGKKENIIGF